MKKDYDRWKKDKYLEGLKNSGIGRKNHTTISGKKIKELYIPDDLKGFDYKNDLSFPGEYPYTRGIHPTMYHGRLWTMRQFSGFGSAEDTNKRYKYLLKHGQTGLSVAFHLPTLMGVDSDHPLAEGEIGKCGVAIDSLADMEILFKGIPLDKITTSMTINPPAAVLWAMYIAVAEKQGVSSKVISGTIQNDILKEYIAQKTFVFPPGPSMKLIVDTFEYGSKEVPRWNTISISGYHIREAGSTAVQELAFTIRDGIEYVEWALKRGLKIDDFAPRLSFFFNSHNDFMEEIAKFRAARRLWAKIMKERFGAENKRSWLLRFHTQTSGVSLMAQQPYNNVVRVAIQALAAVLGGTQSLHTNSLDETYALPSEEAVTIALRTQQIIAHESGVTNTIDPLGGSYFIEKLTNEMEDEAEDYIKKIDDMGGMVKAIEMGFPQKEVIDSSYDYQKALEKQEKIIVGVNAFQSEHETIPLLEIDEHVAKHQLQRLKEVKKTRNSSKVKNTLRELKKAAQDDKNLMPYLLDCVREYATLGEIMDTMAEVYGRYQEPITY
ncbi:MAG: methylmalonyl-CoA mutase family protein [Candidatus Aminicenantes bacterium]|nr:methylmalonyl-CoA mutase family protein [Candidatus Aminicenantes bacterium]HHF51540.1 methylmalonyl-CoA mutase [Candidatus Aminicenantes bacterium]